MRSAYSDLENLTDLELCKLSQEGNPEAENTLVSRYLRLVRLVTRPYFLIGGDTEDLLQEGMIGLLNAAREYKDDKNASFYFFAETCIRNRIFNVLKSANAGKSLPLNSALPLDSISVNEHEYSIDPEEYLIDKEKSSELISKASEILSNFENKVFGYFILGYSVNEIATMLNKEPKSIDNCVQRIKKKMVKSLGVISES